VLLAAEGLKNTEIAERLGVQRNMAARWRARFAEHRLDGLTDEPRPGQPRKITDAKVEEVIVKTLETTPRDATHWSTRSMAAEVGLNQTAVHRIWKAFGLNRTVLRPGSCRGTRSSSRRSAMSSGCT
jgi:transposase